MALLALGCTRAAHVTRPVAMTPMADATLRVDLDRVFLSPSVWLSGLTENDTFALVLVVTNLVPEPFVFNPASVSCWLELSPDQPGETRSFAPVAAGIGPVPRGGKALDTVTIPPGEPRFVWIRFGTYRYPGSDVPRKITVFLPDARGRQVSLVIADPGHGQRWRVEPMPLAATYGVHTANLSSSELRGSAVAGQIGWIGRLGPLLWDLGVNARLLHQRQGLLVSETSGFSGIGLNPHLAFPFVHWGLPQMPLMLGVYAGGEAQWFNEIPRSTGATRGSYGALSAEGGLDFDVGGRPPAQSPFPISFSRPPPPTLTVRMGYTHWWVSGNQITADSGGFTMMVRLTF